MGYSPHAPPQTGKATASRGLWSARQGSALQSSMWTRGRIGLTLPKGLFTLFLGPWPKIHGALGVKRRSAANSGLQFLQICVIFNIYNALMEKVRAETDATERVVTG